MAIANNFDTLSVCSEQGKNEEETEMDTNDGEDQMHTEEDDQRLSFIQFYKINIISTTNGTEKNTYRKYQWKDNTNIQQPSSDIPDSAATTPEENNKLLEPPTKRQRMMLTHSSGRFTKSIFLNRYRTPSNWKNNTTHLVRNKSDLSCAKKCILDLKHCLRYPLMKKEDDVDDYEPVKLVYKDYKDIVEYAYKYFYDMSLAMVYINSSSNCSRLATRRDDGTYRYQQLSDLYPHIEDSIPIPSNRTQATEENESTNESQGRQSSRIKNRKCDPIVHNDFFYYEQQVTTTRKRPQQNTGEKSRQNYSKSEKFEFYKKLNNIEKLKWYDCYHKQQEYYRRYLNSTRLALQSSLFDFDLFELKEPDKNEYFLEVEADRCCYCGLGWGSCSNVERITHVRRHTTPFDMQLYSF